MRLIYQTQERCFQQPVRRQLLRQAVGFFVVVGRDDQRNGCAWYPAFGETLATAGRRDYDGTGQGFGSAPRDAPCCLSRLAARLRQGTPPAFIPTA